MFEKENSKKIKISLQEAWNFMLLEEEIITLVGKEKIPFQEKDRLRYKFSYLFKDG